jgi:hypothetical protein
MARLLGEVQLVALMEEGYSKFKVRAKDSVGTTHPSGPGSCPKSF